MYATVHSALSSSTPWQMLGAVGSIAGNYKVYSKWMGADFSQYYHVLYFIQMYLPSPFQFLQLVDFKANLKIEKALLQPEMSDSTFLQLLKHTEQKFSFS